LFSALTVFGTHIILRVPRSALAGVVSAHRTNLLYPRATRLVLKLDREVRGRVWSKRPKPVLGVISVLPRRRRSINTCRTSRSFRSSTTPPKNGDSRDEHSEGMRRRPNG
jgi:hypothetical protein